jgi:hypothetical protein
MIFAIGAYYKSFAGGTSDSRYERYFQHAIMLANGEATERSTNQVAFLLVECFYLLAVCRTDKLDAWTCNTT